MRLNRGWLRNEIEGNYEMNWSVVTILGGWL